MLTYHNIDPVIFSLGPIAIRWYGFMYLIGFVAAILFCHHRAKTVQPSWNSDQIIDLFFYCALGVIFGGSIGYFLFYQLFQEPGLILQDPFALFRFWEPGRSFHGGLLGVLFGMFVYAKKHHRAFWEVGDFLAPSIPLGLAAGRIGNFINGELWGRVTDLPWAMVFPAAGPEPRHPSQLYEFLLEGLVLFLMLNFLSKKPRKVGYLSAIFLIFYGIFRIAVECLREPDLNQGFVLGGWLTMGQLLSLPMIIAGLCLLFFTQQKAYKMQNS